MTMAEVILVGLLFAGLCVYINHLQGELRRLRIDYEMECTWSDEYARQAESAQKQLAVLRRTACGNDVVQMLSAAWREGLERVH